jgi:hypothetical protein
MTGSRFPGYDVIDQRSNWDSTTRATVQDRLRPHRTRAFFSEAEERTCRALLDRLLGLEDCDCRIPVFEELGERLALQLTDGFRYEDMPADAEAWRISLRELDRFAHERRAQSFHQLDRETQAVLLQEVKRGPCLGPLPTARLWSVWMRYACAAMYSQPAAWSEVGFGGPAYPRGYKNLGLGRRESWEVPDARPRAGRLRASGR